MAENPSTSSEANPIQLPDPNDFLEELSVERRLEMVVETYNALSGDNPDHHLNWENIKGIFNKTKDHSCENEKDKAEYEQRKKDRKEVKKWAKATDCDDHTMFELADLVICALDKKGIIKCPWRGKPWTGLEEVFPKKKGRAFSAYG
jgi:hypothetical protein